MIHCLLWQYQKCEKGYSNNRQRTAKARERAQGVAGYATNAETGTQFGTASDHKLSIFTYATNTETGTTYSEHREEMNSNVGSSLT